MSLYPWRALTAELQRSIEAEKSTPQQFGEWTATKECGCFEEQQYMWRLCEYHRGFQDAEAILLSQTEAKPQMWDKALAHAKALQEQGVKVRIDERWKMIEISDTDGYLHDPADKTHAFQSFYLDGKPKLIAHFTDGVSVSQESFPPPTGETKVVRQKSSWHDRSNTR